MFEIVVHQLPDTPPEDGIKTGIERYRQTVDNLDLQKLINAVNAKPRQRKQTKLKSAA